MASRSGSTQPRRQTALAVVVGVSTLVAAIAVLQAVGRTAADNEPVAIQAGAARIPPIPFITDSELIGLPNSGSFSLRGQAAGTLAGWTSPIGVISPNGDSVVYNAWTDLVPFEPLKSFSQQGISVGDPLGEPSLRTLDITTGSDRLVADGAYSFAWRMDGAVAYVQGNDSQYRAGVDYVGDIFVGPSLEGSPQSWTSQPDHYIVIAWAGETLLAYRMSEGESLDIIALSGPGRTRVLAPNSLLVAISPDGTQGLVSDNMAGTAGIIDIATGSTLASLDLHSTLDPTTGQPLGYLAYGGSWVGDRIAAEGASGIVILDVSASGLSLHSVLSLPATKFPMPPHEPQFTDATASRVIAWAPIPGSGGRALDRLYMYLDCTIDDAVCKIGPSRGPRVFHPVLNPSRPLSDAMAPALSPQDAGGV